MFSSRYLLITDLKPLVDCPCFVPAFVFHQAFNFQISWIWPFCGILACLLMFFWYFYGLLLDHWFEPRFRLPMTRFNWISPNSTLTDSLSVLLWPFWWILPSLLMFFWCLPLTNLWSLVWNNRLFVDSLQFAFSSLVLPAPYNIHLFWCFAKCLRFFVIFSLVNTFWSVIWNQHCWLLITRFNWIPICFPFSTLHVFVVLTFGRSWPVLWVDLWVMFPSHYLLITDLKFFADCQWLVSALVIHPSFFVDLGCIFDLVFVTLSGHYVLILRSVSLCP